MTYAVHTYEETASALQMPVNRVYQLEKTALRKLRKALIHVARQEGFFQERREDECMANLVLSSSWPRS